MTDTHPPQPGAGPGLAELLEDWVTIWQSELTGLVQDREMQDTLLRLVDAWAAQSRTALRMMAPVLAGLDPAGLTPDGSPRPPGPDAPPGPPPAAAAPDGRDAVIEHLLARVAELERRLEATPKP